MLRHCIRWIDTTFSKLSVLSVNIFKNPNRIVKNVELNLQITFAIFVIYLITIQLRKEFSIVINVMFVEWVEGKIVIIVILVSAVWILLKKTVMFVFQEYSRGNVQYVWKSCNCQHKK